MFLDKLSQKEKAGVFIAVFFLSAVILDRLFIGPFNNMIQKISHEISISEKQLERGLRNLNQKEAVTERYQKYIGYVKKVKSDEEEVAKILEEVEQLARDAGVYLIDMKPRAPKQVDFYKEYAAEIEVEGAMDAIVTFLHELSSSTQLLRSEKIRISLKEKDSVTVRSSIVVTKILIP